MERKFAEIIDKGSCFSTINTNSDFTKGGLKDIRIKAGNSEWRKTGFYPKNGMVGVIADVVNPNLYLLLIDEEYYVPMNIEGIKFISKEDFEIKKKFTKIITENPDDINEPLKKDYLDFVDTFKSNLIDGFKNDLEKELPRLVAVIENRGGIPTMGDFFEHIKKYASVMILEHYKEMRGELVDNIQINKITEIVIDVAKNLLLPNKISEDAKTSLIKAVEQEFTDSSKEMIANNCKQYYYNSLMNIIDVAYAPL